MTTDEELRITSIIATCGRGPLLERTLRSIERARKPASFRGLLLVENGSAGICEKTLETAQVSFPCTVLHLEGSNKSAALNFGLDHIESGLVLFLDDDVLISPDALEAYDEAIRQAQEGTFFGGPVLAERVGPYDPLLEPFLPVSAAGWGAARARGSRDGILFLGSNWAASVADIRAAGGFDTALGPGTPGVGDETSMQLQLLRRGGRAQFVDKAVVWHYVPPERCNRDWVLDRRAREGFGTYRMAVRGIFPEEYAPLGVRMRAGVSVILGEGLIRFGSLLGRDSLVLRGHCLRAWARGVFAAIQEFSP